ncbi:MULTISPECIES: 3'-5' exonuclease [Pseudoalteromonas]|jgi:DNA polymerase-3 subunit epsilon|nr:MULTISPECIES: 3'-5' exonuclease [Pseudoalteromonas]EAW28796.1 putative DNA polymerase, exonuclease activity [Alteromonadales bacterium TW-7]ATG59047.1 3'-5' exonuclease [Pseudoalteromonas marina]MDA8939413.1 3'-5' exonuclease [Pseudoalteromonas marina]TMS81423.1 3'-5' exonuclease [Pseudoalteromonas sp. S554]UOB74181.1 3'-5' exonuclease [Pseudoalteromonas sp. APM04]|tara:strand:+ start:2343 stop:2966 length:624 start_codon:yes stop_codon:yes gene_type:complete
MVKMLLTRYIKRRQLLAKNAFSQRYLVIDLELTGLDSKQHEIVSVAWVVIDNQCIKMSESQHFINKDVKSLEQSPVFHGISTDSVAQGQSLQSILMSLSAHFSDCILVFHNAMLDWGFLKLALKNAGVTQRPKLIIDTLQIEKKRLLQHASDIKLDDLTLNECRNRYDLPSYHCHHALTDAQATAELLLAQCHQIGAGKELTLRALV